MYKVPSHIKEQVNRLVQEYELLLQQGHKIALQIYKNNRLYSGLETTEYFLMSVRHFRSLLDSPDEYLIADTEEEFRKKIYYKMLEFYKPLSEEAIRRITHSCVCQDQLERALKSAKRNPSLSLDARLISRFISNARVKNWSEEDKTIVNKEFKLVKTEEAFEKLINGQGKFPTIEITHMGEKPCEKFRIALQTIDIPGLYRKQIRVREFDNFWKSPHNIEDFDLDYIIFNMWNNIAETGIYYVYIPKI